MSISGYSKLQIMLHWLSAAVILWAMVSGFYVAKADVSAETKHTIGFINVSLTTLFIPFFVWRVILSVRHAQPAQVKSLAFMPLLALLCHIAIYLAVCVVLLTGVLMMDRPIDVFSVIEIPQPLSNPALIELFFLVHIKSCVALSLLLMMHIGAVIFHQVRGHGVLHRMLLRSRGKFADAHCQ